MGDRLRGGQEAAAGVCQAMPGLDGAAASPCGGIGRSVAGEDAGGSLVAAGGSVEGGDGDRQGAAGVGNSVQYSMINMEIIKDGFSISTDRERLDLRFIHDYLSKESYWVRGIPFGKVVAAADHSLNFGLYHGDREIGYARIVTDYARVAYLADVFVIGEFRGRGLSKWLIEQIMHHPDLQGLKRWMLHTRDAHGLYTQYGWGAPEKPETYMEIYNPAAEWWIG
jgi:GNAT superfamily N-acetyltransferase